jgi:hypothetical protein
MAIRMTATLVAILATAALQAADETPPPVQQGPGHHFACADYSQGKVFIVTPEGKAVWE